MEKYLASNTANWKRGFKYRLLDGLLVLVGVIYCSSINGYFSRYLRCARIICLYIPAVQFFACLDLEQNISLWMLLSQMGICRTKPLL